MSTGSAGVRIGRPTECNYNTALGGGSQGRLGPACSHRETPYDTHRSTPGAPWASQIEMSCGTIHALVLLAWICTSCSSRSIVEPVSPELVATIQLRKIGEAEGRGYIDTKRYLTLTDLRRLYPDLISAQLATGSSFGYTFKLDLNRFSYSLRAVPLPEGRRRRSFYTDNSQVLRQSWGPILAGNGSAVLR
jgi:hypothetical protein